MRRLGVLSLVASAAFFASSFAVAQDDYLPLVQEETFSIGRYDLSKIDGQQLSKHFQKIATGAIDAFVENKEQAEQIKQTIPLAGVVIVQQVATYVKPLQESGAKYVYLVVEQPKADEALYPYFAIPTKGLSKEQVAKIRDCLKELNSACNSSLKYRFERNGFMIVLLIPDTVEVDEAKTYAKNRFAKFNTVEKPEFAQGFKLADPDAAFVNVALNSRNEAMIQGQLDKFTSILDSAEEAKDVADVLKNSLNKLNELGKKGSELLSLEVFSVNLNAPTAEVKMQAKSTDDAKKYVDLLKGETKDEVSKMFAGILESKTFEGTPFGEDAMELEGVLNDLYDVFTQYKIDGATVSMTFDEQFCQNAKPTFDKVVAYATKQIAKLQAIQEAIQGNVDGDDVQLEEAK